MNASSTLRGGSELFKSEKHLDIGEGGRA